MVGERAPQAVICLDPFHVVVWAMKALDKVRVRTMTKAGISDRHAMWAVRKNPPDLTSEQRTSLARSRHQQDPLPRVSAERATAGGVSGQGQHGRQLLAGWLSWASHSRIPEFAALARSIRRYRDLIWNTLDHNVQRPIGGDQHPPAGTDQTRLRLPQPRRPDRHGHAHPRRSLPGATRPEMTHYNVVNPNRCRDANCIR